MTDEQRKQQLIKLATWGLGLSAALLLAPALFVLSVSLLGTVAALGAAGIVGLAVINFAPVLSMKFANWKLKGLKHEAQQNPIETLENLLIARKQALENFRKEVEAAVQARMDFELKCRDFSRKYPTRATEFTNQLEGMTKLVERKKLALKEADQAIDAAEHKLTEMKAYWEMSQAAQAANKAARMSTGDMYEQLKADTAADAVVSGVNRAFAELEVAATIDAPALETSSNALVIEMPTKERVA